MDSINDPIEKFYLRFRKSLRPVGTWMSNKDIPPDAITWCGVGLALVTGVLASWGFWAWTGVTALLSGLMDVLDGVVAREKILRTRGGTVLDSTLDRYSDFFFLTGIGLCYRTNVLLLLLSFCAIMGSFMVSYSTAKAEAMSLIGPVGRMKRQERWAVLILGCLIAAVSSKIALWAMGIAVGLVAVGSNVYAAVRLFYLWKEASRRTI